MKKLMITLVAMFAAALFFTSCTFFSSPQASSEIISTYTNDSDEYHYLSAVIKVSNTGNKTIYQTVINLQANTNIRTYYKTATSTLTIQPSNSIFLTVDFSFTEEEKNEDKDSSSEQNVKEKWILDSVKVDSAFWN